MKAMAGLDVEEIRASSYTGEFEDLFFHVERPHLRFGRARPPATSTSRAAATTSAWRCTAWRCATGCYGRKARCSSCRAPCSRWPPSSGTVMPAHTHAQRAQPTTLAHYLLAVHDSLSRDLAASGRPTRTATEPAGRRGDDDLGVRRRPAPAGRAPGVRRLVENTYDAIGGADYLGEAATALSSRFSGSGALSGTCSYGPRRSSGPSGWPTPTSRSAP